MRVPRLDAELCTRRVLALEWVDGDKLLDSEPRDGDGAGVARLAVAPSDLPLIELGIECTLSQLLDTGFLHADPHGGNLLKAPCGARRRARFGRLLHRGAAAAAAAQQQQQQLVYLDFGLVARVPAPVRDGLVAAVAHLVDRDVDAVVGLLGELMLLPAAALADGRRRAALAADFERVVDEVFDFDAAGGVPAVRFARVLDALLALALKHELTLPPYFLNNARAIATLEGMARAARPDFNILAKVYPFALRRLLVNPAASPTLQVARRRLTADPRTGRFSARRAARLVRDASALTGRARWRIVLDALARPGGRAIARDAIGAALRRGPRGRGHLEAAS